MRLHQFCQVELMDQEALALANGWLTEQRRCRAIRTNWLSSKSCLFNTFAFPLGVDAMPGDPEQPLLSMQDLPGAVVLVVQHGRLSHIACWGHDTRGGCRGAGNILASLLSQNLSQSPEICRDVSWFSHFYLYIFSNRFWESGSFFTFHTLADRVAGIKCSKCLFWLEQKILKQFRHSQSAHPGNQVRLNVELKRCQLDSISMCWSICWHI